MFSIIYVIEADDGLRAQTSYYLSKQGYSPVPYANIAEFLGETHSSPGCIVLGSGPNTFDLPEQVETIISRVPDFPILILSHSTPAVAAVAAVKAGAVDCVEGSSGSHLIVGIQNALNQDASCRGTQVQQQAAVARLERLSQRERQVLQGLVGGMTNKQIARHLEISPRTVEMHRAHMLSQLEASSSSAAIRLAITAGVPPLADAEQVSPAALGPAHAPRRPQRRARAVPAATLDAVLPSVVDVLEGTTDCVFLLDRDDCFTYFNKAAIETIAGDRELIGENLWRAFPGARQTIAFAHLREAAQERKPSRFEFYEPDLAMWFDVSVRPIPSGLQVFFRDLTRKREAFVALRQSEERLRLALEASGDGAWDLNARSGQIELSRRFLGLLGYDPDSVPPSLDWVKSRIHAEDLPRVERQLEEHLLGRTPKYCAEYRFLDGSGEWRWVRDRGRLVDRDPETQQARRVVGTGTDITDLKMQELHAQEALERLELAQAGAGAGLWDLDLDARTVRLCARSLAMHAIDAEPFAPLPERSWEESLDPEDLPAARRALEEAVLTGAMFRANYRARWGNKARWILGLGRVVPASCGHPQRLVGINLQLLAEASGDDRLGDRERSPARAS
jgi:PAS domain S-box-containing protein